MRFSKSLWFRSALLGGLVSAVAALVPATAAGAAVVCGSTINTNTVLTADLTCSGSGLFIGASDITLDLNGHTITGPGANVRPSPTSIFFGVDVASGRTGDTVKNGTITQFYIGLTTQATSSGGQFTGLNLTTDGQGILTQNFNGQTSDNNTFQNDVIQGTTGANGGAIRLFGNGEQFVGNTVRSNVSVGVNINGNNDLFDANEITQSTASALVVSGNGNMITNNEMANNQGNGVNLVGDNNVFSGNTVTGNLGNAAVFGSSTAGVVVHGNQIQNNRFANNGTPGRFFPAVVLLSGDTTTISGNQVAGIGESQGVSVVNASTNTTVSSNLTTGFGDGISISSNTSGTTVVGNESDRNTNDGLRVTSASTTITRNAAFQNGNIGISAVAGVTDGGANVAAANGGSAQCINVHCVP